jgi:hypothetical protein
VVAWTDDVGDRLAHMGAGPEGVLAAPRDRVQVNTEITQAWRTIERALERPQVTTDRDFIRGATKVTIRVTSTAGARAATRGQVFNASDL